MKNRKAAPLRGMKYIRGDQFLYNFEEKQDVYSHLVANLPVRPEEPMRFQVKGESLEVWYQGLLPILVCGCNLREPEAPCGHKELISQYFTQMIEEIFEQHGNKYSADYLWDEMARKIRLICPQSERTIIEQRKAA